MRSWIGRPLQPVLEERYPGRGAELTEVYRAWNLANHDDLIQVVAGMTDLLDDLQGVGARTGVVSSKRVETVRMGLRAVGLAGGSTWLPDRTRPPTTSPTRQPLLYAAGQLGVSAADCVYVGDATVDVEAARAAGMGAVAVTWGAGEPDLLSAAGPDAVVDDVAGLREVLLIPGHP